MDEGAGQGQPLPLAARDVPTALPDAGLQPMRQLGDGGSRAAARTTASNMSSLVLPNMMLAWTVSSNSSCRYDAASGIFYSWLKPIEQGQNVKFVAGLHGGCLRLVVLKHSRFTKVANLKGATIGVPSMHSSATMFFSMDLLDAGINPLPEAKQVTWKVMDNSVLGDALHRGQVDAIATSDPIAYGPIRDGSAVELANNMSGMNAQDFCCCTAINGDIIENEPDVARQLIRAWCKGSRYVDGHEAEVAKIEVDGKYVATGDAKLVETFLKNYSWKPSVTKLKASLLPGIVKFKKTGYLDSSDDPHKLADTAFTTLGLTR